MVQVPIFRTLGEVAADLSLQVDPTTVEEAEEKEKQVKPKSGEKRFVIKKWNAVAMYGEDRV